jgi:DNA polymerase I-like protein with 3'-5' exonuclease and polymerase domains
LIASDQGNKMPNWDNLNAALTMSAVSLDTETQTEYKGFGHKNNYGLSYPSDITHVSLAYRNNNNEIISEVIEAPFADKDRQFFTDLFNSNATIVCHNAVFDMRQMGKLTNNNVPKSIWCTLVMARLLHPSWGINYDLLSEASRLGVLIPQNVLDFMLSMKTKRKELHSIDSNVIEKYVKWDSIIALMIYEQQIKEIDDLNKQLVENEKLAVRAYCKMAMVGIKVDQTYLKQRKDELESQIKTTLETLNKDGLKDPGSLKERVIYIYKTKKIPLPEWEIKSVFYTDKSNELLKSLTDKGHTVLLRVWLNDPNKKPNKKQPKLMPDDNELIGEIIVRGIKSDPDSIDTITADIPISQLSTGAKVLRQYLGIEINNDDTEDSEDNELAEKIGLYHTELKALADYLNCVWLHSTLLAYRDHSMLDGRIHSLINIDTVTGRRKSNNPQLQNCKLETRNPTDPSGTMAGIFIGDTKDSTLIEMDFSNAEKWFNCCFTGDNNLAAALRSSDYHTYMSSNVYFKDQWDVLTKQLETAKQNNNQSLIDSIKLELKILRFKGKGVTFGSDYGAGAKLIASRLKITINESQELLNNLAENFPLVHKMKIDTAQVGKDRGFIKLWTGRKVSVDKDKSYTAFNSIIQGGVGEMTKLSIVSVTQELERLGLKSRVAIDIHDSLVLSVLHSETKAVLDLVQNIMEHILPEKFNKRTNPAIVWKAEPDLESNAKKWGYRQTIPTMDQPVNPVLPNKKVGITTLILPKLGIESIRIPNRLLAEQTIDELKLSLAAVKEIQKQIEEIILYEYTILFPATKDNKIVTPITAVEIKANFDEYCQISSFWLNLASNCNLSVVIGKTFEELQLEQAERSELYSNIYRYNVDMDNYIKYIEKLIEKKTK